nr:MAG TPA: hypothetical protein [Caudoviricetes sp.]
MLIGRSFKSASRISLFLSIHTITSDMSDVCC